MKKDYIVSIDMGGTKILASAINSENGVVAKVKRGTKNSTRKLNFGKTFYEMIQELSLQSKIKVENFKAICLGVPGSVNTETGIIGVAPNLGLKKYNIKDAVKKYLSIPVAVENDVNLAALGIKNFDCGIGKKNFLTVFVGTGIGGGLILDGKIFRGSNFVAGEIGHLTVDPHGPICGCGKKGCFEAIASRTAIVRDIQLDIRKGKKCFLSKLVKSKIPIKSKALAAAIDENDKVVIKHVNYACEIIGKVLADVNNLLNLELIVLGGGVIEAIGSFMLPQIKISFKKYSLLESAKSVKIFQSKLGDEAALYGGIVLAEEMLGIKV